MIERDIFGADHVAFRDAFRKFCDKEVAAHHEVWEEAGTADRAVWNRAGKNGFLCMTMPPELGGSGGDKLFSVAQREELARGAYTGIGFGLHSEVVAPYLLHYGTQEQKRRYLPRMASGETIGAIAMTEPGAGSDVQGIRSTALRQADGSVVLNGSKTFITNGWHADLVLVVAKTQPYLGAKGTSLFLIERGMPGFEKGKRLKKPGLRAQDTSELFFDNVRVPAENLLGGPEFENRGFVCLMGQLPWERMQIAINGAAASQAALDWTIDYVKQRRAFGKPVASFQNTRFKLGIAG